MACPSEFIFTDLTEDQFKENLDEDVRYAIMQMDSPRDALLHSQALKEEENELFKTEAYRSALNRYEKSIQYFCVVRLSMRVKMMQL